MWEQILSRVIVKLRPTENFSSIFSLQRSLKYLFSPLCKLFEKDMRNAFARRDATGVSFMSRPYVAHFFPLARMNFARGLQDWARKEESNGKSWSLQREFRLAASNGIRTHDTSNVLFCLKHFTNSAIEVIGKLWEKIQEYLISFFSCSLMFASNLQGFHLRVENFFKLLELFMILAWKIEQFNRA